MAVAASPQAERAELEALLDSGIFDRAPNLARFLTYVCERYFEGGAHQIKEYNIAVDALGRPLEFDQKKDSIVRVEAHLLRKRLNQYYAGAGSGHAYRIVIPNGQYAPQFVIQDRAPLEMAAAPHPVVVEAAPVVTAFTTLAGRSYRNLLAAVVLLCALGLAGWWVLQERARSAGKPRLGPATPASETWTGAWTAPVTSEFRMLAGHRTSAFTDRQGRIWQPDAYYRGGVSKVINPSQPIEGVPDPQLFRSFREGAFLYDIPLRPGVYELHLYFADTEFGVNTGNGDIRCFQLRINDLAVNLFDPASEAGAPNRLHVRVFKDVSPAADGKLHMGFSGQTAVAFLNALEILPSAPGRIRPIRLVAAKNPATDVRGQLWSADEYAIGGHLVERNDTVRTAEGYLYRGERFGNFSYRIPVAPGRYQVKLRFAETYFGSKEQNAPAAAVGRRVFDVFANGVALLRNFDILKETGGPNIGIDRTFRNLQPNAQGLIILEFTPIRNYACVNAIEIEETD